MKLVFISLTRDALFNLIFVLQITEKDVSHHYLTNHESASVCHTLVEITVTLLITHFTIAVTNTGNQKKTLDKKARHLE